MKLSLYTFVKDGLFFDYHVVDMLRHHLPLADEIVVCEGYSNDGTYEAISNIDAKIKIHRQRIDTANAKAWLRSAKDQARQRCTGDWCIRMRYEDDPRASPSLIAPGSYEVREALPSSMEQTDTQAR